MQDAPRRVEAEASMNNPEDGRSRRGAVIIIQDSSWWGHDGVTPVVGKQSSLRGGEPALGLARR